MTMEPVGIGNEALCQWNLEQETVLNRIGRIWASGGTRVTFSNVQVNRGRKGGAEKGGEGQERRGVCRRRRRGGCREKLGESSSFT